MRFEHRVEINAPIEQVWDAFADPLSLARLVGSAMTITPASEGQQPGRDARYRVLMKIGAALVGGDMIIVEYTRPREFAWKGFTGVDHRLRLRLRPGAGGSTMVTLRFAYDAPGVLGTAADLAAYPRLHSTLEHALTTAKHELEEGSSPAAGSSLVGRLMHEGVNAWVLARAGIIRPMMPDKLFRLGWAARTWGLTLATAVSAGAIRHPDAPVVVDEFGALSYADADRRSDAIATGLLDHGVAEGDSVAVLVRNHRGFVTAVAAAAKVGADVLLLNTGFSAPQLVDVCQRERASAVICDAEFAGLLDSGPEHMVRLLADPDADADAGALTLQALAASWDGFRPPVPERSGKLTILTSGTTGTPKGASRGAGGGVPSLDAPAALLDRIPLRSGMRIGLAAPAFHAWGLANFAIGLALGATQVMLRRFDPEAWLAEIERSRCQAFVVVPVMLQRILELPEPVRARYDTSSLTVVSASGSALPGDLANRWMDAFGDTLYNLYGSTEVANATIATPEDLRAAPGTAGRPTRGTTVRLLNAHGVDVLQGQVGRIFVGNAQLFEGYTGGGDKERIGGLMATGDLGRFDAAGRLFVEGRDDEMIVSGGENVFPREVEDVLAGHPAIVEAACVGVPDDQFGQRLRAFVVLRDGRQVTEDELKDLVRDNLARYKVPRDVQFLAELPRNATGKILKAELAQR